MIYETVPLPFGEKNNASLKLFIPEMFQKSPIKRRPTVLVIPGGGYHLVSRREGECIALRFLTFGYNAAVLSYSTKEDAQFPQPLCEAALAMAYLKENADRLYLDPSRIYTCGFSAGGHLALSLGVYWDKEWLSQKVGKPNEALRPAAQVICYPLVSADLGLIVKSSTTIQTILGSDDTPERRALISLEKHISASTPPTFLWTTQEDQIVSCEHSLLLATALQKCGVPTEFHMYGWGRHGLSLANRITQARNLQNDPLRTNQINPHIATWLPLCHEWLEETCGAEILPPDEF